MFLFSPIISYFKTTSVWGRGFSLIELLISIAIIVIVTLVGIVQFTEFDSSIILKSVAYEIAVSLRESQVYSVGVLGESSDFDNPFGMSFEPESKQYKLFRDIDSPPNGQYDSGEEIDTFTIGRTIQVSDVCVTIDASMHCDIDRLDISFKRPEFSAIIYGENAPLGIIRSGLIKLNSTGSQNDVWVVEVLKTGQITVKKE